MNTNKNQKQGRLTHQFIWFLFLILFINTFFAVTIAGFHFNNEYIALMQSRVEIVGNNLKTLMEDILRLGLPIGSLEGVEKELDNVVNGDVIAVYANVVDNKSNILYSFPEIKKFTPFHTNTILPLIKTNQPKTFPTGSSYNTFIPIEDPLTKNVVGGINIGILKTLVYQKTFKTLSTLILIFIFFIIATVTLLYWNTMHTIKPLEILTRGALALGEGDLSIRMDINSNNEIGSLAESFNYMAEQLQGDRIKLTSSMEELERQNAKLQLAHEEILQREQKLKEAQMNMVLSEKMASLGILIAGIAHEINTPIGAIANVTSDLRGRIRTITDAIRNVHSLSQEEVLRLLTFAEEFNISEYITEGGLQWKKSREIRKWLLDSGVENEKDVLAILSKYNLLDKDKLTSYLSLLKQPWVVSLLDSFGTINVGMKICESSIRKISAIVKALKNYAYTDMDKTSSLDINENIENVLLLMHNKLKYKIAVEKDFRSLPKITCTSEISQVWTNLISNAHDAIMESQNQTEKGMIKISTREKDGWIRVKITDNGVGIMKEYESKVFDPFFTTKEIGKGTGLGLSIVSGIIKKHNGSISVDSIPGRTTFTVLLPKDKGNGGAEIG